MATCAPISGAMVRRLQLVIVLTEVFRVSGLALLIEPTR
jgi:hypothetical protein